MKTDGKNKVLVSGALGLEKSTVKASHCTQNIMKNHNSFHTNQIGGNIMVPLRKIINIATILLCATIWTGCVKPIELVNRQPVYFGDRLTPTKTLDSSPVVDLGRSVYGSATEESKSTTTYGDGYRITTTESKKINNIAYNIIKALGNDQSKFISKVQIDYSETHMLGYLLINLDFTGRMFQVKTGGNKK